MKILLVEDNSIDADLTKRGLLKYFKNCSVEIAASVSEAREFLLKLVRIDLAILDMKLPDGNGLDVLNEIKHSKFKCPVIFLTGSGNEEMAAAALRAGADDYFVKREGYISKLPQVINSAIANHEKMAQLEAEIIDVLYVEHHQSDIDLTMRYFLQYAPQIHIVPKLSAEDALKLFRDAEDNIPFHVILIDYRLPGIDALEFTKILRQEYNLTIPIIIVTGHGNEETVIQALKLGVDDYLVKRENYLNKLPSMIQSVHQHHELILKQIELKKSETNYRLMFENNPQPMWIYDVETLKFL